MKGFCGRTSEKLFGPTENLTKPKYVKKKQQTTNEFGAGTRKVNMSLGTGKWNTLSLTRKHGKMKSSVKDTEVKFVSMRVSTIYGGNGGLYTYILTFALESTK